METSNLYSDQKSFSWLRIRALIKFYSPIMRRQVLTYSIASVVAAIIMLLPLSGGAQMALFSIVWTALPLLFELAPCILCKQGDYRIIERMIPATATEKYVFRLVYFLIIVPICVYLLPELASEIYEMIPAIQTEEMLYIYKYQHFGLSNLPILLINVFTAIAATLTCLYVVTRARHSRMVKGVISVFAVSIFVSIMGAIMGWHAAFRAGFEDGMAGVSPRLTPETSIVEIQDIIIDSPFLYVIGGIILTYVTIMFILNYRILKNHNI